MPVAKSWAYRYQKGPEIVKAWAITQERRKFGGEPLGGIYWSSDRPDRRRMKQVQRKSGATFFAYISNEDAAGSDGGESLTHRLLKEAIAGLARTRLNLGKHGEHDITVTHGETEKEIATPEGLCRADVYLRFATESLLGLKWSGEVYIEVRRTHAVPPEKQQSLRHARIPVIEVPVLKPFEYPYEDEDTTDPREEAHKRMIQGMLQEGFLIADVISNPSSLEYLEMRVPRLRRELATAKEIIADTTNRLDEANNENAAFKDATATIARQRDEARDVIDGLGREFTQRNIEIRELKQSLIDTLTDNAVLRRELRTVRFGLWFVTALFALAAVAVVFWLL